jgi:hypothetical protein
MPDFASSESVRRAVLRVAGGADPAELLGTAFGIAEHWALTCAHVVPEGANPAICLTGAQGTIDVVDVCFPPNREDHDLALLKTRQSLQHLLPCTALATAPERLFSRGYFPEDAAWGGRELRFQARGRTSARYAGGATDFAIGDAFDLAGDPAAKGFSGSPVVDVDSGCVVAVVSGGNTARGRSWAVQLSSAKSWPRLGEALAENDRRLPRFGAAVNHLGAIESCRWQSQLALQSLLDANRFVRAWDVRREAISNALHRFRRSDFPVLAVVGDANVGKTWALASEIVTARDVPSLLVLASALDGPDSLADVLNRSIEKGFPASHGARPPQVAEIANAARAAGGTLMVLLDGINESPRLAAMSPQWLPEAVGYCRRLGIKLVVTCRSELWPTFARRIPEPENSLFVPGNDATRMPESRCLHVGTFTQAEAVQASQRYALPIAEIGTLRSNPLLFRIARDLGLQQVEPTIGRYRLLEAFLLRRLDEIATRVPGTSTRSLRPRFSEMARKAASGNVSWSDARAVLGDDAIVNSAIDAGLLTGGDTAVRFSFDQILDLLRLQVADPSTMFRSIIEADDVDLNGFGDACLNLLRFEANGEERAFQAALSDLLATLDAVNRRGNQDPSRKFIFGDTFFGAVAGVAQSLPPARSGEAARLYEALAACGEYFGTDIHPRLSTLSRWLFEAPLPAAKRVQLLLRIAAWDSAWPWRRKDWSDPHRRRDFARAIEDVERGHIGAFLHQMLVRDPGAVRGELLGRLNDETAMGAGYLSDSRGEATIATLCAGVLFHDRHIDRDALYEAVLDIEYPKYGVLLQELASDDPDPIGRLALRNVQRKRSLLTALRVLSSAAPQAQADLKQDIETVLGQALTSLPKDLAAIAAKVVRRVNPSETRAWDWLLEERGMTAGRYDGDEFVPIPPGRFAAALGLVGRNPELGIAIMGDHAGPADEQEAMAATAMAIFLDGRGDAYEMGALAEIKLNRMYDDPKFAGWIDFVRAIVRSGSESAVSPLLYSILDEEHQASEPARSLAAEILGAPLGPGVAESILKKIGNYSSDDVWFGYWEKVRAKQPLVADWHALSRFGFVDPSAKGQPRARKVFDAWKDGHHAPTIVSEASVNLPFATVFSGKHVFSLKVAVERAWPKT